ncbi:MAG: hypothetical protein ACR2LX_04560 [Jatrophihabitans sp.]
MAAQYIVRRGDPDRIAKAVVRYQAARLQFWAPLAVVTVALGLLGSRNGHAGAVGGVVLCVLIVAGVLLYKRRQLRSVLAARGFRPGTTVTADFGDSQVAIAADGGTAVHPYREIADARRIGDVVLLRLRQARLIVALPGELVPDARLHGLQAVDRSGAP